MSDSTCAVAVLLVQVLMYTNAIQYIKCRTPLLSNKWNADSPYRFPTVEPMNRYQIQR
jgi:hypothetical protein